MYKYYFSILCLIGFISVEAQEDAETLKGWENVELDSGVFPIHRISGIGDVLCATDYGDGQVYVSYDAGTTWSRNTRLGSEYIERVQLVNKNVWYICGDYGYVYKTQDGGKSWKEISPTISERIIERYRGDSTKNQEPQGKFVAYYNMHFFDEEKGFISGYSVEPSKDFRETFHRIAYITDNGGEEWKKTDSLSNFIDRMIEVYSVSHTSINNRYYQDNENYLYLTRNKSRKDVLVKSQVGSSESDTILLPEYPYERGMLRHLFFLDDDHGFILGGALDEGNQKAIILETKDGGDTWNYVPSTWQHIHAAYIRDRELWIAGKENMIKRKRY